MALQMALRYYGTKKELHNGHSQNITYEAGINDLSIYILVQAEMNLRWKALFMPDNKYTYK